MPVYHRYAEDLTGVNSDNRVTAETIILNDRPIRVAIPKYGPFFTEHLVVYDNVTQRLLVKNVDYRIPHIVREATLQTGLEVADCFLIINPDVSSAIRATTQVIGGHWQNNTDNIVNIYESFLNDNRSVDWVSGVHNKPDGYTPALHPTFLSEIFGFGPLAMEMERIAKAIELSNVPAFEMMLEAIQSKAASLADMNNGEAIQKFVTLEGLLYALDKYNFNSMSITPEALSVKNGMSLWFDVEGKNLPSSAVYYWTIESTVAGTEDFVSTSGIVTLTNGKGQFSIQSALTEAKETSESFRVYLRRNSPLGQVVLKSQTLYLSNHNSRLNRSIMDAMMACCPNEPNLAKSAKTYQISRSMQHVRRGN